ncbi:Crp/Fnr family transcriptional regulator [candidate division KSB1 bacterium]
MQTMAIETHSFLKGLDKHHIENLAEFASEVRFQEGEIIYRKDEIISKVYLIIQGKVSILSTPNKKVTMQTIGGDEVLDCCLFFSPHTCQFEVRAVAFTQTIAIDCKGFQRMCEDDHEFGCEMYKRIVSINVERYNAYILQLLDIYE